MTDRGKRILGYLKNNRSEFLKLVKALVEAESPTSVPSSLNKPFSILEEVFVDLGFEVERIPGRRSAGQLAIRPAQHTGEEHVQLLLGHCDTVWPIGTLKEMPCIIDGNILKGPGSFDMKAGLSMIVFALRALHELEYEPEVPPAIFINSDEETGSDDSEGQINRIAQRASRVFVLEPALGTDGKIKTQRKGVGHFDIYVKGKPSHAGLAPEEGVSAILGLSHIVQHLFDLNDPSNGISVNVGTIEGGERTNVIAAESKAAVDVRVLNQEDGDRIEREIHALESHIEGVKLEIKGGIERPPLEKTPANRRLWHRAEELAAELDLELEEGTSGGASDGNLTSQHVATLDGLGAVGEGAHAYHEQIFIDETIERCALLALLILEPRLGKEDV